MMQLIGFAFLFFLPLVESFNRQLGFDLLLLGSFLISFRYLYKGKIIFDGITFLWIIMLIVYTFSLVKSLSFYRSYFEYLRYIAYFLIFISIRGYGSTKRIYYYFFLPMVTVNTIILGILAVLYSIPSLKLPSVHTMTLFYPSFGHNHLSDILVFAIPISFGQLLVSNNKIYKIFWLISNIAFVFLLIFSFGRAAILSLVLSIFIFIFYTDGKSKIWNWLGIVLELSAISTLGIIFYISNISGPLNTNVLILKKLYRPYVRDFHLANDYQAIAAWSQKPIFGWGLNTFRLIARSIPPVNLDWYTHNQYLEILAETGLLGFIIFISLILTLLRRSIQKIVRVFRIEQYQISGIIFISILATSIQSFFDYQWHYISIFLLFWLGFALMNPAGQDFPKRNKFLWNFFLIIVSILFLLSFEKPFHSFQNMY